MCIFLEILAYIYIFKATPFAETPAWWFVRAMSSHVRISSTLADIML